MVASILIVDGDVSFAGEVAAIIRDAGGTANTAATFREAVGLLEAARPDVLVTSLQLGPYNGLHLLLRARLDHAGLSGIVIGPKDPTVEREAKSLGAAAYLARPLAAAAIMDAIRAIAAAEDEDEHGCSPSAAVLEASMS